MGICPAQLGGTGKVTFGSEWTAYLVTFGHKVEGSTFVAARLGVASKRTCTRYQKSAEESFMTSKSLRGVTSWEKDVGWRRRRKESYRKGKGLHS